VIRYRNGVLNGKGASLLDGYMEDLATDRIYRLMIAQRMAHVDDVVIDGDEGKPVRHSPELITRIFDEELERLIGESPSDQHATLREARRLSEEMIVLGQFDPV
jgi:malate synthase